jgi:hypothetical protein
LGSSAAIATAKTEASAASKSDANLILVSDLLPVSAAANAAVVVVALSCVRLFIP